MNIRNIWEKKHNLDGKEYFHGNRDFYHLVKIISKHIIEKNIGNLDANTLLENTINSIERNFSGMKLDKKTSTEIFKECFNLLIIFLLLIIFE